ncbi:hypothetical protein MmiEs2_00570 [Methanimicrococcus stummii]|uniref:DUF2207 domain-containing protein n=1 Tax=Methanimicrococcus stummii TaxID=3028294 RepID=A0AA96V8S2_9EURY|nr:DUF2207 domain-containing protein [Methanimicrococcus sp. Es2]WNY27880.1 hypothetical protein MmiEs2_00570 [Methanimicrococcus sp. Es2]
MTEKMKETKENRHFLKKTAILSVFALLLLLALSAPASAYTMENADVNIIVDEKGIVYVNETIKFRTEQWEEFTEAYRYVQTNSDITIQNATGYLEGYESGQFYIQQVYGGYELVCKLPQPIPREITFVVSYEYYGGINVYDDITEFNYNIWGNNWGEPIQNLNANITFLNVSNQTIDGANTTLYWSHPFAYTTEFNDRVVNSTAGAKTISFTFNAKNIPAYTPCDVRIAYPRLDNPDSAYVNIIAREGLDEILEQEAQYERKNLYSYLFLGFQILVIVASIAAAFYIYNKYGREHKVNYSALYERDLPTDTKPAVINAIIVGHGKPNMDGFVSTIMSLVDRNYLSIREIEKTNWRNKSSKEVVLKFELSEDGNLEDFERDVYRFLRRYAAGDEIVWGDFQKKLGSSDSFYNFLNSWNSKIQKQANFSKYFDETGNKKIASAGIVSIVCSILIYFISEVVAPSSEFPTTSLVFGACVVGLILGVVLIAYPIIWKKSMGQWTPEGRVFYLKWKNFEKYLTDYSLIEKYPPASVIIWDHYIVYAMALGVAEEALKNMNLAIPTSQMSSSRFGVIYYYPLFYTGMGRAYASSTPNNSGGGGGSFGGDGIGGGFGGGGGGLR